MFNIVGLSFRNYMHVKPIQILCISHFLKIDIYALKILKFYFNLYHDKLPPNMSDYKILLSSRHPSYDWINQTYQLLKVEHEYAKRMIYYQLPIIINSTEKLILDKTFTNSFHDYSLYIKIHMWIMTKKYAHY